MKFALWFIKVLAVSLLLSLSVCGIVFGIQANHLQHEADKYKQLTEVNREMVIQTQIKYERMTANRDELLAQLEDRDLRLAAAAERERAREVRASRSRSREARSNSDVQRRSARVGRSTSAVRKDVVTGGARHDITKYCPTGNTTASGKRPREGMVATLSRSIPFGTHVLIEGLGEFVVEDRIGHGSEFDIFTSSCREAEVFGRQHRRVTILEG